LVNLSARHFLDKSRYHLIKNVTLPTEDGTTQIDHILISEFGVFVVETKNMKGWTFGSATQGLGYVRYLKSKRDFVLSPKQVAEAREKVASGRLKASLATGQAHARHVRRLVAERYGTLPRHSSKWLLKIVIYPIMLLGVAAIMMNAVSDFVTESVAIGMRHMSGQRIERPQQPVRRQPEIQTQLKAASENAGTKMKSDKGIQRFYQSPSELFLARQECNSLIAAVIGNQDARLLRDRDKACARYQVLKEEVH